MIPLVLVKYQAKFEKTVLSVCQVYLLCCFTKVVYNMQYTRLDMHLSLNGECCPINARLIATRCSNFSPYLLHCESCNKTIIELLFTFHTRYVASGIIKVHTYVFTYLSPSKLAQGKSYFDPNKD